MTVAEQIADPTTKLTVLDVLAGDPAWEPVAHLAQRRAKIHGRDLDRPVWALTPAERDWLLSLIDAGPGFLVWVSREAA
jgi:hypothetical protein